MHEELVAAVGAMQRSLGARSAVVVRADAASAERLAECPFICSEKAAERIGNNGILTPMGVDGAGWISALVAIVAEVATGPTRIALRQAR